MSIKFLHLCHDDKFIQFVQDSFESVFPGRNRYIVWGDEDAPRPAGYAKAGYHTRFVGYSYLLSRDLTEDLAWCDAAIVHCMTPWAAFVALRSSSNVLVVWSGWGFDYYDLIRLPNGGVLKETHHLNSYTKKSKGAKRSINAIVRGLERRGWNWVYRRFMEKKILPRVKLFSSPIPEDWGLLRNACHDFKAEYVQLNYGSVDSMFRVGPDRVSGRDILIGNSASATNNHAEAFETIRRLDLEGRCILVPLSYGDINYAAKVIALGERMFGDKFHPLVDFIPINKYNEIIASCSIVLMNHLRQQGLGNINIMLYKGAKVFLNKENPIYGFFKAKNTAIFRIDEIDSMGISVFEPLARDAIALNKSIIDRYWSADAVSENIHQLGKRVCDLKSNVVSL
ncbi:TDP-N-acetylfucosamine:lipid II N-acetylfucosaminyltransferase [Accumulibacter sp.]|uniref:TDP-N-acetylfucosamine:lipid II N-acetylfucosaminyltransferase n=1 Tax=Accumulibacter sp. TaxID=2053492 RepID=UPI0028C3D58A|nr:TDP-N-acetylfucosamine:lipid II N-acetylfucosaminyltransferase [Accumulibacter sp.]